MDKEKVLKKIKKEGRYKEEEINMFLSYIDSIQKNKVFTNNDLAKNLDYSIEKSYDLLSFLVESSIVKLVYKVRCEKCNTLLNENYYNFNTLWSLVKSKAVRCSECNSLIFKKNAITMNRLEIHYKKI